MVCDVLGYKLIVEDKLREGFLEWLSTENISARHEAMRDKLDREGALVESAGKGFLDSEQFKKWSSNTGILPSNLASNLLFCHGKRI